MGRPTKRNDESQDAIIEALTKGYTRKAAAAFGGVSYQTLREWEKAFPEFSEALEKAEGIAQNALIDTIVKWSQHGSMTTRPDGTVIEGPGAWQAAAWVLERRWPKEYSRREAVEMSGPDGGPIDTRDLSKLADHEKEALTAAIRDHLAGRRGPAVRAGTEQDPESRE